MNKRIITILTILITAVGAGAQTLLADFEDGTTGTSLKINKDYTGGLFSKKPAVMDNPKKDNVNPSDKCLGAINVADADWYKNFLILEFTTPFVVDDSNRILTLKAYRSIQPKEMRIAVNGYEDDNEVYRGMLKEDGKWETITIDLAEKYYDRRVEKIYIVLSCNWSDPRKGWGEATYCFDDIALSKGGEMPAQVVSIDATTKLQTMKDFGASDCWTADFVGKYFSQEAKANAARWLFSREMDSEGNPEGIGLSCWRVNIGAGSATQGEASNIEDETRRAECFQNADGSYDWTRQAGQQYFMDEAKRYGVENYVLFSNSAPIYYTKNGKANANGSSISCNLKDDCYDDFADFLVSTASHFKDEGYNVTYIDPVNEPQFDWKDGQEGSPWENQNIAKLAKELDKSMAAHDMGTTRVLIPEASSLKCLYGETGRATNQIFSFFNTSSANYIGNLTYIDKVVAGHSYWTYSTDSDLKTVRQKTAEAAQEADIDVMQTEWSMLGDAPKTSTGFPSSYDAATKMDMALFMAKVIYADIAIGNMTAWSYWTAMAQERWSQKNRFYLIRLNSLDDTGDESYADLKNGGKTTADKNLWALGNYSRFVRPGYQRVAVDGADDLTGLMSTAYLSPDGKQMVVVMVNMSRARRTANLSITGFEAKDFKKYVTDKDHDLSLDSSDNGVSSIAIPSRSVTTVVINADGTSDIEDITIVDKEQQPSRTYNLKGMEVKGNGKGIVIKNGKKEIINN